MVTQTQIADALAAKAREVAYQGQLLNADVLLIDTLAAALYARFPAVTGEAALPAASMLTVQAALELVGHEAIVLEWYKDSSGVGTWGIGVTNASGHNVDRYKDKPQTVERVLEIFVWLLRTKYVPDVLRAFSGTLITIEQFAAALSFHYNTGAILRTDWVPLFRAGKLSAARTFLETHYLNGGVLTERRAAEAELFFDGVWSNDGTTTIWPVKKPSYTPDWGRGRKVAIRAEMEKALAV